LDGSDGTSVQDVTFISDNFSPKGSQTTSGIGSVSALDLNGYVNGVTLQDTGLNFHGNYGLILENTNNAAHCPGNIFVINRGQEDGYNSPIHATCYENVVAITNMYIDASGAPAIGVSIAGGKGVWNQNGGTVRAAGRDGLSIQSPNVNIRGVAVVNNGTRNSPDFDLAVMSASEAPPATVTTGATMKDNILILASGSVSSGSASIGQEVRIHGGGTAVPLGTLIEATAPCPTGAPASATCFLTNFGATIQSAVSLDLGSNCLLTWTTGLSSKYNWVPGAREEVFLAGIQGCSASGPVAMTSVGANTVAVATIYSGGYTTSTFSGSIGNGSSATTTLTTVASGGLASGQLIEWPGMVAGPSTVVTGGGGTSWTVNEPQLVAGTTMTAFGAIQLAPDNCRILAEASQVTIDGGACGIDPEGLNRAAYGIRIDAGATYVRITGVNACGNKLGAVINNSVDPNTSVDVVCSNDVGGYFVGSISGSVLSAGSTGKFNNVSYLVGKRIAITGVTGVVSSGTVSVQVSEGGSAVGASGSLTTSQSTATISPPIIIDGTSAPQSLGFVASATSGSPQGLMLQFNYNVLN
jgi:hypothetical protein